MSEDKQFRHMTSFLQLVHRSRLQQVKVNLSVPNQSQRH